jgi:glycosyltransferase involved in cell wall biosynthesis
VDRLSLKGHQIRVIDYEISWRQQEKKELYTRKQVFKHISKVLGGADITLIRPGILKIPGLDYLSLIFSHRIEIGRQIEEFHPDVVIGFGILNAYLAMNLAKKKKIPFVYYLIDALHTLIPFKVLRPLGKIVEKQSLKRADRVIVINEKLMDYAIGMEAPSERTSVVGAGVDLDRFNSNVKGRKIRRQCRIKKNDTILFFMGWLYDFSGLKEVAHTLLKIKDKRPDLKLLVVGEGDLYPELLHIREKHNLQDHLILAGRQPYEKIPEFTGAADICLLPAHHNKVMQDIVPIKMYEYMACGKPIISTKLPGVIKEFGYDNGVEYVDDPEEVIEKAIRLSENKKNLIEGGSRARKFVEKYSWDNITQEFETILKNTINSR